MNSPCVRKAGRLEHADEIEECLDAEVRNRQELTSSHLRPEVNTTARHDLQGQVHGAGRQRQSADILSGRPRRSQDHKLREAVTKTLDIHGDRIEQRLGDLGPRRPDP